ncbi:DNA sulfur modification protein DndD [Aliivibrio fischeri]|uniref:DNA sulfur modification protein DndD n=1 Tax=Aliivibrio fischeri TaxID=668 RepID=UPI003F76892B
MTKLKSDLMIYLKKNDAQALPQTIRDEMNTVEKVRIEHERKSEKLRYEADIVAAQIESTTVDIQRCESDLSQNGGAWAKTRESEALKVDQLLKEKSELEKQLRTEFEGSLPFAFAPNTMKAVIRQIEAEKATKQKQSFSNELNIFLDSLRQDLALRLTNSAVAMETINDSLQAFMNKEQSAELIFDISEREAKLIEFQTQHQATDSFKRFDIARTRLSTVEYELDNASTNIARAPEQEQVQELFTKVRNLDKKKEDLIREYRTLLENAKLELRNALEAARKVQKLHDKNKDAANQGSGISNAQNALILLDKFAEQLTHARVKQLEKEFVSSYKNLARKDDLHITAVINPQTFDVNLVDEHGIKINRKAMSAGEKQIYAISILEALGRTSGRKLPIIIDTPLGRLDSHHRDKLVENYFPNASHQVVILSTDTEIDKDYINMIQDDIAQTYEISFDGLTKSSKIKTGYFWKDKLQEAM